MVAFNANNAASFIHKEKFILLLILWVIFLRLVSIYLLAVDNLTKVDLDVEILHVMKGEKVTRTLPVKDETKPDGYTVKNITHKIFKAHKDDIETTEHDVYLYDYRVVQMIAKLLAQSKDVGFIDIGAHTGEYTVPIAVCGYPVLAVEPVLIKCLILQKSLQYSRTTSNVTLLQNAIFTRRTNMYLTLTKKDKENIPSLIPDVCDDPEFDTVCVPDPIKSIILDDIVPLVKFPNAIMKISFNYQDLEIFKYAKQLLRHVNITHIFTKFNLIRISDEELTSYYKLMQSNKYIPYTLDMIALDMNSFTSWSKNIEGASTTLDIVWIKH